MDAEGSYTGEATRIQSAALCVAERHGALRSGRPLAVFTRVPEVWLLAPTSPIQATNRFKSRAADTAATNQ
jgi:hypothetical protein